MQAECVRTWKHLPDASYGHNSDRPKPITEIFHRIKQVLKLFNAKDHAQDK